MTILRSRFTASTLRPARDFAALIRRSGIGTGPGGNGFGLYIHSIFNI
jgi:hypothetical protein